MTNKARQCVSPSARCGVSEWPPCRRTQVGLSRSYNHRLSAMSRQEHTQERRKDGGHFVHDISIIKSILDSVVALHTIAMLSNLTVFTASLLLLARFCVVSHAHRTVYGASPAKHAALRSPDACHRGSQYQDNNVTRASQHIPIPLPLPVSAGFRPPTSLFSYIRKHGQTIRLYSDH